MKRRWKWLVAGLAVLWLGAFLFVSADPNDFEPFRRLKPISEGNFPNIPINIATCNSGRQTGTTVYETYQKHFDYGPLDDAQLSALRKAYRDQKNTKFFGQGPIPQNAMVEIEFAPTRSSVTLRVIKEPSRWDQFWIRAASFIRER